MSVNGDKVYVLGDGGASFAANSWPKCEVVELGLPFPTQKAEKLVLYKTLCYATYQAALLHLKVMADLVVDGGEVVVVVPSADWAIRELLRPDGSRAAKFMLHGPQNGPDDVYKSSWTLEDLRTFMSASGLAPHISTTVAEDQPVLGAGGEVKLERTRLNVVAGHKVPLVVRDVGTTE